MLDPSFLNAVNTDVLPSADNTYSLGSSSLRWKDIYVGNALWLRSLNADDTNTARNSAILYFRGAYWDGSASVEKYIRAQLIVSSDGWNALNFYDQDENLLMQLVGNNNAHLWIQGNFYPRNDNTQNLGSSSNRWKDGYFAGSLELNSGSDGVRNIKIYNSSGTQAFFIGINTDGTGQIDTDGKLNMWLGGGNIREVGDILPNADSTGYLGSGSLRWKTAFFGVSPPDDLIRMYNTSTGDYFAWRVTSANNLTLDIYDATNDVHRYPITFYPTQNKIRLEYDTQIAGDNILDSGGNVVFNFDGSGNVLIQENEQLNFGSGQGYIYADGTYFKVGHGSKGVYISTSNNVWVYCGTNYRIYLGSWAIKNYIEIMREANADENNTTRPSNPLSFQFAYYDGSSQQIKKFHVKAIPSDTSGNAKFVILDNDESKELFKVWNNSGNITLKGDIQINGNDIKDSSGTVRITLGSTIHFSGSIELASGNEIYLQNGGESIAFMGANDTNYRKALYCDSSDNHWLTNRHTNGDTIIACNNGTAGQEVEGIRVTAPNGNVLISNDLQVNGDTTLVGVLSKKTQGYSPRSTEDDAYKVVQASGPTSDFLITLQDGTGRVQFYWNSTPYGGTDKTNRFIVGGENAGKILFSPDVDPFFRIYWANGSSASAGDTISFSQKLGLYQDGDLWIAGTLTEASSIRFKENIREFNEHVLDKILNIAIKRFRRKDTKKEDFGLIAEELPEELITRDPETKKVIGYNLSRLVIYLLKALQELYYEVKAK